MSTPLRAYMVSGPAPEEEAVLVFAPTAREARKAGWRHLHLEDRWIEVRARRLRGPIAEEYRDPEKEEARTPYAVHPTVCWDCELWHAEGLDGEGLCASCAEHREEEEA